MATAQKDHDNAVRIKDNANGWLSGAPLAAEQADVAQSQQLTQEARCFCAVGVSPRCAVGVAPLTSVPQAIQQQQQLNNMEGGDAADGNTPWKCGAYCRQFSFCSALMLSPCSR